MTELREELLGRIDGDREKLVRFLSGFLKTRTPNPPGDTREAYDYVRALLEAEGIAYETIAEEPTLPNILASLEGTAPGEGPHRHLALNGHMDVFPVPEGEVWDHGPWSGDVADGRVWGRGGVDMKAGTTASLFAFLYLNSIRHAWRGRLTLSVVSDEETMGPKGTKLVLDGRPDRRGDCCINAEPSSLGTVRYGEKGLYWLRMDVRTSGAHGAYPHMSRSANKIAAALIRDLEQLAEIEVAPPVEHAERLRRSYAATDRALGPGTGKVAQSVVVNIGTMQGGIKVNVIPSRCTLEVDLRLPIGLDIETLRGSVLEIMERYPEVSVQEIARSEPNFYPEGHPMLDIMIRNVARVTGRTPEPIIGLGATDARLWRHRGIPAFVYGPSPAGMGGRNEAVSIEEFMAVVKVHCLSAYDYLSGASA
jgi:succinyl-diaminopimelate desuccinylase